MVTEEWSSNILLTRHQDGNNHDLYFARGYVIDTKGICGRTSSRKSILEINQQVYILTMAALMNRLAASESSRNPEFSHSTIWSACSISAIFSHENYTKKNYFLSTPLGHSELTYSLQNCSLTCQLIKLVTNSWLSPSDFTAEHCILYTKAVRTELKL